MASMVDVIKAHRDKRILVTGHTGFKGTWMVRLLRALGAKVSGIGLYEGDDKIYALSKTTEGMDSHILNICDFDNLNSVVQHINPQIVFHLAAQPLVIAGYKNPIETFSSNVMGTANILEACRNLQALEAVVCITTDKVYHNHEWGYPYRETDPLGGHDPYSASKAACEMVISSYRASFYEGKKIASVRAGNVIGGGDFADNRIVPDLIRSISVNTPLILRAPESIRPWQHVLDALWGYLLVAEYLVRCGMTPSPSYNIAPPDNSNSHTVLYVVQKMIEVIGKGKYHIDAQSMQYKEMGKLRLDPSLIREELGWTPVFTTEEAIVQTAFEYKEWLADPEALATQIDQSISKFLKRFPL